MKIDISPEFLELSQGKSTGDEISGFLFKGKQL
jgi:hypothetical protein